MTTNGTKHKLRVGINGFGRIGRAVLRVIKQRGRHQIVHINDVVAENVEQVRYLLQFDSIYGRFPGDVKVDNGYLLVHDHNSQQIDQISLSSSHSSLQVDWRRHEIEVLIEATGSLNAIDDSRRLLERYIPYVVITTNLSQADKIFIPWMHSVGELPSPGTLISATTCDVVAVGPLVHAMRSLGNIEYINIVTIHPWLNYQPLLDSSILPQAGSINQDNFGLGRAATISVLPKTTSLESALVTIFPELNGRIRAHSYRIPTPVVCYGDMNIEIDSHTTREEVVQIITSKAPLVGFSEEALVSVDFVADPRPAIVDLRWLRVAGTRVSLVYAYDNEWGYANYVSEILDRIADRVEI